MRSSATQELELAGRGSGGKRKRGRDEDSDDEPGSSDEEGELGWRMGTGWPLCM